MLDPSIVQCASIRSLWKLRSLILVEQLKLHQHPHVNFTEPLMRYILSSHLTLPVKTVVLVERPYRTSIHAYASAAMSYDVYKSGTITPSTAVLATDMKNKLGTDWNDTEAWFRDSWMYIKSGVFLINVCCFEEFMGNSLNERVAMESFIRDMIVTSYGMSGTVVDLVALGNPAISSTNRIRSNIANRKKALKVHRGQNPAGLRHRFGDLTSPDITIGPKELSKALHRAIVRSSTIAKCTATDFDIMNTLKQANVKSKIIASHRNLDEDLEKVTQFFKSGGKYEGPVSDEEVFVSFRKNLSKFVDVLIDERVIMKLSDLRENDTPAKGAYSSGHRGYEQKQYKTGGSSEVSSVSKGKPVPMIQRTKWVEEEDDLPSTPTKVAQVSSEFESITLTSPVSSAPETPKQSATNMSTVSGTRSVSARSSIGGSKSSSRMKFIEEEESDQEVVPINLTGSKPGTSIVSELDSLDKVEVARPASPTTLSVDEAGDMAIIGEFLHSSAGEYGFSASIIQEINEAATTGRASSEISQNILKVVRNIRSSGKSTVEDDMGFVTGTCNRDSPLMQLLLQWAN